MELRQRIDIKQSHFLKPRQAVSLRAKLVGRMKLGQFFSLSEEEFSHRIEEIEKDTYFQKLLIDYKIVSYRKFRDIIQPSTLPLREELTAGGTLSWKIFCRRTPQPGDW